MTRFDQHSPVKMEALRVLDLQLGAAGAHQQLDEVEAGVSNTPLFVCCVLYVVCGTLCAEACGPTSSSVKW